MPKLSVIIINYKTPAMTEKVIRNFVLQEKDLDYEIILIDNESDGSLDSKIFQDLNLKFIQNKENIGFARAVNQGIENAQGDYVLLLNSDVLLKEKSISKMLDYLYVNSQVGVIGPRMLFPGGKPQASGGRYPNIVGEFLRLFKLYNLTNKSTLMSRREIEDNCPRQIDWLSGGCLLIRKSVIEKIGSLDEKYFLGMEDMDFCYRANQAGYGVIYYPKSEVIHYHGFSSGGTGSLMRLKYDRDGIASFLQKHFPKNQLQNKVIVLLNNIKIALKSIKNKFAQKNYRLRDATIAITYSCNSRCQMCNIWQIENPASMSECLFENLSKDLRYINLSGGEPFLHPGLVGIVHTINRVSPKAKIIISSNGLATDLIVKTMEKIRAIDPRVGIRISLDGLAATHDKIRGIPGMFRAVMKTVSGLKAIGISNLGFSFTIMNDNVSELPAIYDLSKEMEIELAIALVQNSDIYFGKKDNSLTYIAEVEKSLNYVIENELKSKSPKRWARAYYDYGLLSYAKNKERLLKSGAGFDSAFIDSAGNVFPSNLINLKIGNINSEKIDKIWNGAQANTVRNKIIREVIEESWIICTIRGEMKRNILKVGYWVIRNKFL